MFGDIDISINLPADPSSSGIGDFGLGAGVVNVVGGMSLHNVRFISNTADVGLHGVGLAGGMASVYTGTILLDGVSFISNTANFGGGLVTGGGGAVLNDFQFIENEATGSAVLTSTGQIDIDGVSFAGGMINVLGAVTLTNGSFVNNAATFGGRGIAVGGGMLSAISSTATLIKVDLVGNTACGGAFGTGIGGGLMNALGKAQLTNARLFGNRVGLVPGAIGVGGGMANVMGQATLVNTALSGDFAASSAGALLNISGTLTLLVDGADGTAPASTREPMNTKHASTERLVTSSLGPALSWFAGAPGLVDGILSLALGPAGNRWGSQPAGQPTMALASASIQSPTDVAAQQEFDLTTSMTLTNVTLANNLAFLGGGIHNDEGCQLTLSNTVVWGNGTPGILNSRTASVNYSDIEGGWPTGTGNIGSNPDFVDANGLDDIIGTLDDDLRLGPNALAIDAGDNNSVPADVFDLNGNSNRNEPLPIDLGNNPRFIDADWVADSGSGTPPIVDMGAYESQLAVLQIEKYRRDSQICATWKFSYYVKVTNPDAAPATGVLITDTLPLEIAPYSVQPSPGGAFDGDHTVTWGPFDVDPNGGSALVWVKAQTYSWAAGRCITNQAIAVSQQATQPVTATEEACVLNCNPPAATPTPTLVPTPTPTPIGITVVMQKGLLCDSQDTFLYRYNPDRRHYYEPNIKVGYKQLFNGLLWFDLCALPEGVTIEQATLQLYASGWSGADVTLGAYAVLRDSDVDLATWNEAQPGEDWSSGGANDITSDRRAVPEDSLTTTGPRRWYSFDVTELVQQWVDGSLDNNGILLLAEYGWHTYFFNSNEATLATRPKLVVTYQP